MNRQTLQTIHRHFNLFIRIIAGGQVSCSTLPLSTQKSENRIFKQNPDTYFIFTSWKCNQFVLCHWYASFRFESQAKRPKPRFGKIEFVVGTLNSEQAIAQTAGLPANSRGGQDCGL
jgi:hypothetical protein